jgi:hypothetical protein
MERNDVLGEFWALRKLLNQGNKLVNEQTDLRFKIEAYGVSEFRLKFEAIGKNETKSIEISRRDSEGNWERSGFTSFKKFEIFCSHYLNDWEERNSLEPGNIQALCLSDIQIMVAEIQKEFDSNLMNYAF